MAAGEHPPLQLLEPEGVDEPLHAGPQLVVAVAGLVEDPQQGLDGGHEVLAAGEVLEGQRGVRGGAQAAGDEDPEAGLDPSVVVGAGGGDDPDVVEHGLAAVGAAAREVDLELAGEALGDRVAQEVLEGGLGPRGDVEDLERAGPGEVAALHVADRVAAGLAGGQPHGGEVAHDVGDLLELDVVELDVLAGGEVAPATRVPSAMSPRRSSCSAVM